jgi:hypothetical protein
MPIVALSAQDGETVGTATVNLTFVTFRRLPKALGFQWTSGIRMS